MNNLALPIILTFILGCKISVVSAKIPSTGNKAYVKLSDGMVDSPVNVMPVSTSSQCAWLCTKMKLCSAFSLRYDEKNSSTDGPSGTQDSIECQLTQGQFTWTPDPTAEIFGETLDGRYPEGYSFAKDGMLYKFSMISNVNLTTSRTLCNNDAASIAVPYPNISLQAVTAIQTTILASAGSSRFFVGLTRSGNHAEGRWVTDDGHIFFETSNESATELGRRLFEEAQPDGDGDAAEMRTVGRLNDLNPSNTDLRALLCRKEISFMKSPINGKFYRLFRRKTTHAQAVESCASFGGTLANVYSDVDFIATEGYRMQTRFFVQATEDGSFWVGGTDEEVEGTWIFPDGTRMLEAERLNDTNQIRLWATGQPNGGQNANCLVLSYAGANDQACNSTYRYLCEAVLN